MKKVLITLTMLLALGATTSMAAAQKHRHHATVTVGQNSVTITAPVDSIEEGIEAFSDTTGLAADEEYEEGDAATTTATVSLNPDDYSDPFTWIRAMQDKDTGLGKGFVAIVLLLIIVLFLLLPLLIIGLIFYFIYSMGKRRQRIAQAAASAQPAADSQTTEDYQPSPAPRHPSPTTHHPSPDTAEDAWRRGIKHLSIGAGVVIFGIIAGSETLTGIGAIIICYGAGQAYIAKKEKKGDA